MVDKLSTPTIGNGRRKPVFWVSDQVRLKPVCSATMTSWNIEIVHIKDWLTHLLEMFMFFQKKVKYQYINVQKFKAFYAVHLYAKFGVQAQYSGHHCTH